ncbi:pentapeptide repeat-containing protein [Phenylobacterium sp.]|uniref:pentapeptide repeat-containing protein n=1 Tax=Phenylobacterium sp. TaxID=1871053 RepID=UPI002FC8857C
MAQIEAGARIVGEDLSAHDFTDSDLTDAVFEDCVFADVQFQGVCLQGVRFKGCRIVRSRFAHADLREAVFEDCVCADDQGHVGPQFAFSRLEEARFDRCDLSFARIERSALYGIEMDACNLRGAVFLKADFGRAFGRNVVRWSAALKGCNLELADLTEVRLPDCDLNRSSFREALLIDADLEGADLRECDLFQALTAGAKLARADLRGAEVSGLNLLELASRDGMKVTVDQQYRLLNAMGVDVHAE